MGTDRREGVARPEGRPHRRRAFLDPSGGWAGLVQAVDSSRQEGIDALPGLHITDHQQRRTLQLAHGFAPVVAAEGDAVRHDGGIVLAVRLRPRDQFFFRPTGVLNPPTPRLGTGPAGRNPPSSVTSTQAEDSHKSTAHGTAGRAVVGEPVQASSGWRGQSRCRPSGARH